MGPHFPSNFRPCTVAVFLTVVLAMSACGNQGQTGRVEDTSGVSDTGPDTADTSTTEPDSGDTSTTGPETTPDTEDSASPDVDTLDTHDSRPDEESSSPDVPDTAEPDWTTSENYPRVIPTGDPCETNADCAEGLQCDQSYKVCVECLRSYKTCKRNQECIGYRCVDVDHVRCEYDFHCKTASGQPACSPKTRTCTECVRDWQCPTGHRCLDEQCIPAEPCTTSLNCSEELVCARNQSVPMSWCVECGRDSDCPEADTCGAEMSCEDPDAPPPPPEETSNLRFKPCTSDRDCRDLGLLCNFDEGHCGECTAEIPCGPGYACQDGFCVVGECKWGQIRCAPACTVTGNCDAGIRNSSENPAPLTGWEACGRDGRWSRQYDFCDPVPGTSLPSWYCDEDTGWPPCQRSSNASLYCPSGSNELLCLDAHVGYRCGFGLVLQPCGLGEGQPGLQFIRE